MIVCDYILWFFLYSIAGWIYETIFCSIRERRLISRGFLNGLYCPIYGVGAILSLLLLSWIENPVVLFFATMLVVGALEYFTGWLLEKLFHARWWDYSGWKFNLHGRVSLLGLVVFSTMSVLMLKVVQPYVALQTDRMPDAARAALAVGLAALLVADTVHTVMQFKGFNEKLEELHTHISSLVSASSAYWDKARAQINDGEIYCQVKEKINAFKQKLNRQEQRMLSAFPKFTSTIYNDVLMLIRNFVKFYG